MKGFEFDFGSTTDTVSQRVMDMCSSHFACDGCPLKDNVTTIGGQKVFCNTGLGKTEAK